MDYMDLRGKLQRLMWLSRFYQQKNYLKHGPMADPSRGQGRVLAALKMQSEISTKDLAYLLGIRTQSLNELLGKLEKNGFITRTQSEEDKRIILVKLTEKGKQEKQQDLQGAEFDDLFDCLNEDEQKSFGDYLDRIIAALEAQVGGEPDDAEFEWIKAARERFGANFDQLMGMRHGGNPSRRGRGSHGDFGKHGGVDNFPHGGHFGDKPGRGKNEDNEE